MALVSPVATQSPTRIPTPNFLFPLKISYIPHPITTALKIKKTKRKMRITFIRPPAIALPSAAAKLIESRT